MTETETQTPTSWKQLRVKTNLGTLVSILVAVIFITFQGTQIRTQIDDNSRAVSTLISAVEELSATFDDLDRRVSEAFGAEMAGGGE